MEFIFRAWDEQLGVDVGSVGSALGERLRDRREAADDRADVERAMAGRWRWRRRSSWSGISGDWIGRGCERGEVRCC